jgi:stearoyl-CoA desaturase (delta-9 desaturase)
MRYPELVLLNRFDWFVPLLTAIGMYALGHWLARKAPHYGTDAAQILMWGFVISTIILSHATFTINSLAHIWGRRRYETRDDSRNNLALSLLTLGEGWHNNHHKFPMRAKHGVT